jgi:hypothetical protein
MTLQLPASGTRFQAGFSYFTLGLMAALAACSSPNGGTPEAGGGAAGAGASGSPGTAGKSAMAGHDTGGNAAGGSGTGGAAGSASEGGTTSGGSDAQGGEGGTEEYGFTLRKPGAENLDWLCTFNGDAEAGYVYVRLVQTGTEMKGLAETPVYAAELAQLSVNGKVSALQNAHYDYGGGHRNDALSFDYGGKTHSYYHSSFGFGFRSCQPMDCRNVHALGMALLETEGCGATRSLPETCVAIEADGSHDMLVDTFRKCPGDSR